MRIGIIGSRGYPHVYSGYETFVSELAPRLVQKGHQVFVYCHRSLFMERPAFVNGVQLFYIPSIERKTLSQLSHTFLSTLHVLFRKLDVILYVNSANGPFGLFTKLFGKRTAINVDGLEWLRPKWKGLGAKYFKLASYLSTRLFDVVITDSERMAEVYKEEFESPSITIAYGEEPEFSVQPDLIKAYGLSPKDYYLVVGRLIPDNNADLIVRGFELTKTERKLVIVGGVPYQDEYAESVRNTEDRRIIFVGYVRNPGVLRELYCNSYAYVHGHEFGGTNPTLLKALGCGCTILALDTPFSREVLKGEKHGAYFRKDPENLASLVEAVDDDESFAQEKRRTARARIGESYTWEKIVGQYEKLFYEMMKGNS